MTWGLFAPARVRRLGFAAFLALGPAALGSNLAGQRSAPAECEAQIQVQHPWVRWLPGGLPAAGYLTLANTSDADRFLTGAVSRDYANVTLHQSYTLTDGDSGMRPVPRLRIPACGKVELVPGGYHLMLMQARRLIKPGETVTVELEFADGRSLSVVLPVKPPNQSE